MSKSVRLVSYVMKVSLILTGFTPSAYSKQESLWWEKLGTNSFVV